MGILGIGVDVLHAPRVLRLVKAGVKGERFACRILSETEFTSWTNIPRTDWHRKTQFLAVRWSVKEAAYKAVFPRLRPTWKDFTFHSLSEDGTRKPFLEHTSSDKAKSLGGIHASVSHDGDYVFATVIVETP